MVMTVTFGINEGVKEELTKYGVGALGAFAGFGISDFTAEYIASKVAKTAGTRTGIKIVMRVIFFALFFVLSTMTSGLMTWFIAAMGLGSFAGIYNDIFEYFVPGGFAGLARALRGGAVKK